MHLNETLDMQYVKELLQRSSFHLQIKKIRSQRNVLRKTIFMPTPLKLKIKETFNPESNIFWMNECCWNLLNANISWESLSMFGWTCIKKINQLLL